MRRRQRVGGQLRHAEPKRLPIQLQVARAVDADDADALGAVDGPQAQRRDLLLLLLVLVLNHLLLLLRLGHSVRLRGVAGSIRRRRRSGALAPRALLLAVLLLVAVVVLRLLLLLVSVGVRVGRDAHLAGRRLDALQIRVPGFVQARGRSAGKAADSISAGFP